MAVFSRDINFLSKNTQLVAIVNPSGDFDKTLLKGHFISIDDISNVSKKQTQSFIPIYLKEPLIIQIYISKNGKISKELKPCECTTPVLPNESLTSINSAYQRISQLFERTRSSHGGKIYNNILFKDNDKRWELLEVQRERVYKEHQEEFEKRERIINEELDNYAKPLFEQLDFEEQIPTEIINILKSEN